MKTLLTLLLAAFCAATGHGQTLKSLMYNTTNGQVVYSGTNTLTFTNELNFGGDVAYIKFEDDYLKLYADASVVFEGGVIFNQGLVFNDSNSSATTRTNLGLGATNDVVFNSISFSGGGTSRLTNDSFYFGTNLIFSIEDASFAIPIAFAGSNTAATTRTNLGLGGGITATNTFVSYNGTNYTTNSVSISNGVITGWTQ